eukprot:544159_1
MAADNFDYISNCSISDIIASVVVILINIIFLLFSISMTYTYISKHYNTSRSRTASIQKQQSGTSAQSDMPKLLYYTGLMFVIISIILLTVAVPFNFYCDDHWIFDIFTEIFSVSYSIHCYLMLILWFLRIYYVFKDTEFALNKCAFYFYFILAAIMPFLMIYSIIILSTDSSFGLIIFLVLLFLFLIFLLSLVGQFVFKLIRIYKNLSHQHQFIGIITRSTILTIFCLVFSIIYGLLMVARNVSDYILFRYLRNSFQLLSIFINYVCVLLSYHYFDGYYAKCCTKMDNKCTAGWYKCVNVESNVSKNVTNNSGQTQVQDNSAL